MTQYQKLKDFEALIKLTCQNPHLSLIPYWHKINVRQQFLVHRLD
jgi:hypothetical protein